MSMTSRPEGPARRRRFWGLFKKYQDFFWHPNVVKLFKIIGGAKSACTKFSPRISDILTVCLILALFGKVLALLNSKLLDTLHTNAVKIFIIFGGAKSVRTKFAPNLYDKWGLRLFWWIPRFYTKNTYVYIFFFNFQYYYQLTFQGKS